MRTAKEMAEEYYDLISNNYDSVHDLATAFREFAKLHVEAALKVASEKAEIYTETYSHPDPEQWNKAVRKSSILNAYPLENIK